jgi:hypothetical protein
LSWAGARLCVVAMAEIDMPPLYAPAAEFASRGPQ